MTPRLTLMLACAALGGCAGLSRPDLPTCDGSARRPANPHGSILTPSTPAAISTPAPVPSSPSTGGCA